MKKKRTIWEKFGHANFAFFYRLIRFFSLPLSRSFLYLGLEDRSIYEDQFTDPVLSINVLGKQLLSPIGIAAGFDTSFKYNDELVQYGFGFEEFGTFTQTPISEKMKIQFIPSEKNIVVQQHIFSSNGIEFVQKQLIERRHLPNVVGVSLAMNTSATEDDEKTNSFFSQIQHGLDQMTRQVAPYCDYITINLSHPKIPFSNLLTNVAQLEETLLLLQDTIRKAAPITQTKLVIKLPLNLNKTHIDLLAELCCRIKIDAVIIGGYVSAASLPKQQTSHSSFGYVSGRILKELSNRTIQEFYQASKGQIPIIACGGIFTGDDAFEKITLGASLFQIHSAILYKGPSIANQIAKRLAYLIKIKGFKNIQEAVGSANKISDIQQQEAILQPTTAQNL